MTATVNPSPVVRVDDLHVAFGEPQHPIPAVRGVSLEIRAGQCVALVGESGSGKSVTARSLIGLPGRGAHVRAASLEIAGQDARSLPEREWRRVRGARVGYVLQDALVSLDPLRPIGREIDDALRLHTSLGRAERRALVEDALTRVAMPQSAQRSRQRSGELSGGLRQRALIATAIALNPPVLVADEPTTALDSTVQSQILDLLSTLTETGTGLLLISHDLAVVGRLADRISVMHQGEIVEEGTAEQILGDPQHDYTKRLLAAVPTGRPRGSRLSDAAFTLTAQQRAALTSRREEPREEPATTVLLATGLRKAYKLPDGSRLAAVDDVSFSLARGRTLGVVGESGSGKTTAARIALGLVTPDAGEVQFLGQPWNPLPERQRRGLRRHLAAVYQDPLSSFDPQWSVGTILGEALVDAGTLSSAERREEVAELLGTVRLDPAIARRSPRHLSGGQRQRVAIARALAGRPDVIVCDEPVAALDVSVQAQVLDLLDDLQRELGLSYLFISHDLGVIEHVSDEVIVMSRGRVVESGGTEQVIRDPQHDYTRTLLAAAPRLAPRPVF